MKPYLLDTNVLIALTWPNHVHHLETLTWFSNHAAAAFRTCPITQTGFVRISSNPAFTKHAVPPAEALALLRRITELPGHEFWPADLSVPEALDDRSTILTGHRQVTDAYLLRLASHHDGVLATLDRAVAGLARGAAADFEIVA